MTILVKNSKLVHHASGSKLYYKTTVNKTVWCKLRIKTDTRSVKNIRNKARYMWSSTKYQNAGAKNNMGKGHSSLINGAGTVYAESGKMTLDPIHTIPQNVLNWIK